jgi:heat shock protein HslJ
MNSKPSLIWRFTSLTVFLLVGAIGLAIARSAIAERSLEATQPLTVAQAPAAVAQAPTSIQGNWRLVNMTEPPFPTPMVLPPTPELTADFAGDRIAGSGGCNRFSGGYTTQGNQQLSIGPLASTFKACAEPIMTMETKYLTALQGAQRYEVNQDGLQIFYQTPQGSGVLRFTARAIPALW